MATPGYSSIPQQTLAEVTKGVVQETPCFADLICRRRTDVKTLAGVAPFLTSDATTARGLNRDLAPGADARAERGAFGSVNYNCLRQTGLSEIFDESQISASAYDLDLIAHWLEQAVKDAGVSTDLKLADVLASTTLNAEYDVTTDGNGEWDDLTNGTPAEDIVNAADQVPIYDLAVIGRGAANALRNSPAFQGRFLNYTGGGSLTLDELRGQVASLLGIPQDAVWILQDAVYNGAALGQPFAPAYIFGDGMWIGRRDDLQLFDPQAEENHRSEQERQARAATSLVAYHRYVDIIRHVQANGVTLTNILT